MVWPFNKKNYEYEIERKIINDPDRALRILASKPKLPDPFVITHPTDSPFIGGYYIEVADEKVWGVMYNTGGQSYIVNTPFTYIVSEKLEKVLKEAENTILSKQVEKSLKIKKKINEKMSDNTHNEYKK